MVTRIERDRERERERERRRKRKGRTDNNQGKEARKRDGTLFL